MPIRSTRSPGTRTSWKGKGPGDGCRGATTSEGRVVPSRLHRIWVCGRLLESVGALAALRPATSVGSLAQSEVVLAVPNGCFTRSVLNVNRPRPAGAVVGLWTRSVVLLATFGLATERGVAQPATSVDIPANAPYLGTWHALQDSPAPQSSSVEVVLRADGTYRSWDFPDTPLMLSILVTGPLVHLFIRSFKHYPTALAG